MVTTKTKNIMRKKKQHLDFYKSCIENNYQMPCAGLCHCAYRGEYISIEIFAKYLKPTKEELLQIDKEYANSYFWASGNLSSCRYQFTPLRQTIVLFMAAIAGEFD